MILTSTLTFADIGGGDLCVHYTATNMYVLWISFPYFLPPTSRIAIFNMIHKFSGFPYK